MRWKQLQKDQKFTTWTTSNYLSLKVQDPDLPFITTYLSGGKESSVEKRASVDLPVGSLVKTFTDGVGPSGRHSGGSTGIDISLLARHKVETGWIFQEAVSLGWETKLRMSEDTSRKVLPSTQELD